MIKNITHKTSFFLKPPSLSLPLILRFHSLLLLPPLLSSPFNPPRLSILWIYLMQNKSCQLVKFFLFTGHSCVPLLQLQESHFHAALHTSGKIVLEEQFLKLIPRYYSYSSPILICFLLEICFTFQYIGNGYHLLIFDFFIPTLAILNTFSFLLIHA